jgi:prepilin-type processing-associated H-X9-DG protein
VAPTTPATVNFTAAVAGGPITFVDSISAVGAGYPNSAVFYLTVTGGTTPAVIQVTTTTAGALAANSAILISGGNGYTSALAAATAYSPSATPSGPYSGGMLATITGSGFFNGGAASAVTTLTIGGIACTSTATNPPTALGTYHVISDTQISLCTPAITTVALPGNLTTGAVDILVTTAGGTSVANAGDKFTYTLSAAATAPTTSPAYGPNVGGTPVNIKGLNFTVGGVAATTANTTVTVGGVQATIFSVTQTLIVFYSPPGSAVNAPIVVTCGGVSSVGAENYPNFAYSPPRITAISDYWGATSPTATGGTTWTVTGAGFIPWATGTTTLGGVGGTQATLPVVTTSALISAGGYAPNSTTIPVQFTPAPQGGTTATGTGNTNANGIITSITITNAGSGYATAPSFACPSPMSVQVVGGAASTWAAPISTSSTLSMYCINPGGNPGTKVVTVSVGAQTSNAVANGSSTNVVTFVAPTLTSISPTSGSSGGGTTVTFTGTGFPPPILNPTDPSSATAVLGSGATAGQVTSVTVFSSTFGMAGNTYYSTAPAISFTPPPVGGTAPTAQAVLYEGMLVGINIITPGSGYSTAPSVFVAPTATIIANFGNNPATGINCNNSGAASFTALSPAGTGTVNVTLTIGGVTATQAVQATYTYVSPTVLGFAPRGGLAAGGTTLTFSGTNFGLGATVTFNGTTTVPCTVSSGTKMTCVTPAWTVNGNNAVVPLTVSFSGAAATMPADPNASNFTFGNAIPTVTNVTPGGGPLAILNAPVTITGTGFTGATQVYFGTTAYSLPGTGSGCQISITGTGGALSVASTTPTAGGSGYPVGTVYLYVGGGTGGIIKATTTATSGGAVISAVTLVFGGTGYTTTTTAPTTICNFTVVNDTTITVPVIPVFSTAGQTGVEVVSSGTSTSTTPYTYGPMTITASSLAATGTINNAGLVTGGLTYQTSYTLLSNPVPISNVNVLMGPLPTVTFSAPALAAASGGVTATGTPILSNGVVTGVLITSTGFGYAAAPTWTCSAPPGTGGTVASGTGVLGAGNLSTMVTSVNITSGGSGYGVAAATGVNILSAGVLGFTTPASSPPNMVANGPDVLTTQAPLWFVTPGGAVEYSTTAGYQYLPSISAINGVTTGTSSITPGSAVTLTGTGFPSAVSTATGAAIPLTCTTNATVTITAVSGAITAVTATPATAGAGYPANATFDLIVTGSASAAGSNGVVRATTNGAGVITFATTPVLGGANGTTGYTSGTYGTAPALVAFNGTLAAASVVVGATFAAPSSSTATSMTVTVPLGATPGLVTVQAPNSITSIGVQPAISSTLTAAANTVVTVTVPFTVSGVTTTANPTTVSTVNFTANNGVITYINSITAGAGYPTSCTFFLTINGSGSAGTGGTGAIIQVTTSAAAIVAGSAVLVNGGTGYTTSTNGATAFYAPATASGPLTGGMPLIVSGSDFAAGSTVYVGGILATSNVVVNAGTITCISPAAITFTSTFAAGATSITASSATGLVAGQLLSGPGIAAGTVIGPAYVSGTTVPLTIATTAAVTTGTIFCGVPAGNLHTGQVDVQVKSGGVLSAISASDKYTYTNTVTSGAYGPNIGGSVVTIGGLGFPGGATVSFTAVNGVITAVTPTPPAGGANYPPNSTFTLNVIGSYTNPGGAASGGVVSATTNAAGQVASYAAVPVSGGIGYPTTGTGLVTLDPRVSVTIGSLAAPVLNCTTTQILCASPPGTYGVPSAISVTCEGVTSVATPSTAFNFPMFTYAPPVIIDVSDAVFPSNTTTYLGGSAVTVDAYGVVSGAVANSYINGQGQVTSLLLCTGFSSALSPPFTHGGYSAAPTVTIQDPPNFGGVTATAMPIMGGPNNSFVTGFTITNPGSGYTTAPLVYITHPMSVSFINPGTSASIPATNPMLTSYIVSSPTLLLCTMPAGTGTPGQTPIAVLSGSNPTARGVGNPGNQVTLAAPTIASVSPTTGALAGGTPVTVTGTYLPGHLTSFTGDAGPTAVLGANGSVSSVTVTIGLFTALPGYFVPFDNCPIYNSAPTVTFSPSPTGNTATGTASIIFGRLSGVQVTNAGSGYTTAPTVYISPSVPVTVNFGANAATLYGATNSSTGATMVAFTPPATTAAGVAVNVALNSSGTPTLSNAFTYQGSTITGYTPTGGLAAGGTAVTFYGTNFGNGSTVTFTGAGLAGGAVTVAGVANSTGTTLTVISPPFTMPGAINTPVTLSVSNATMPTYNQFYYGNAYPTVTGVGPNPGGGEVSAPTTTLGGLFNVPATISGAGFTGMTSVQFYGGNCCLSTIGSGCTLNVTTNAAGVITAATVNTGGSNYPISSATLTYCVLYVNPYGTIATGSGGVVLATVVNGSISGTISIQSGGVGYNNSTAGTLVAGVGTSTGGFTTISDTSIVVAAPPYYPGNPTPSSASYAVSVMSSGSSTSNATNASGVYWNGNNSSEVANLTDNNTLPGSTAGGQPQTIQAEESTFPASSAPPSAYPQVVFGPLPAVIFSAPTSPAVGAGGIQATGTPIMNGSGQITGVYIGNAGYGYVSGTATCAFSVPGPSATGTWTTSSAVVTTSATVPVGAYVSGNGIPIGATVLSVVAGTSMTLSATPTIAGSSATFYYGFTTPATGTCTVTAFSLPGQTNTKGSIVSVTMTPSPSSVIYPASAASVTGMSTSGVISYNTPASIPVNVLAGTSLVPDSTVRSVPIYVVTPGGSGYLVALFATNPTPYVYRPSIASITGNNGTIPTSGPTAGTATTTAGGTVVLTGTGFPVAYNTTTGAPVAISGSGATVTVTTLGGSPIAAVSAPPPSGGSGYPPNATFNLIVYGGSYAQAVVRATTNASGVVTSYNTVPVDGGSSGFTANTTYPTATVLVAFGGQLINTSSSNIGIAPQASAPYTALSATGNATGTSLTVTVPAGGYSGVISVQVPQSVDSIEGADYTGTTYQPASLNNNFSITIASTAAIQITSLSPNNVTGAGYAPNGTNTMTVTGTGFPNNLTNSQVLINGVALTTPISAVTTNGSVTSFTATIPPTTSTSTTTAVAPVAIITGTPVTLANCTWTGGLDWFYSTTANSGSTIAVGQMVTGTGVPANTVVTAIGGGIGSVSIGTGTGGKYSVAPTGVSFTGGGSGAIATITTTGTSPNIVVSAISITNPGVGYVNPTVTFIGGTVGTGPAASGWQVNPTIYTNNSNSSTISALTFTFTPVTPATPAANLTYTAPTGISATPNTGPLDGGTQITITGSGFTGITTTAVGVSSTSAIMANAVGCTNLIFVNDTTIMVTTPAYTTAGLQGIQLKVGTMSVFASNLFTYTAATVTGVAPNSGPITAGAGPVTIAGSGFNTATLVLFGNTPVTLPNFTIVNDGQITVPSVPAGLLVGPVAVQVTTGTAATTTLTAANTYTYLPVVTGIATAPVTTPPSGPATGGTSVTITGAGFTGALASGVLFGTSPATSLTSVTPTQIVAVSPSTNTGGPVDVTVSVTLLGNPYKSAVNAPADRFTYLPVVASLSTSTGPTGGGTSITITGSGFGNASGALTAVNFGSVPASSFTYVSATSITAVAPAVSTAQTVDVTVIVSGATSAINQPADQFTYGAPTVTSLTNTTGPASGGTTVTINGTNFASGATVTFGGVSAGSVAYVSSTQLTAVSPVSAISGPVDVIVTSGAVTAASSTDKFTYVPAVISLSTPSGSTGGGTSVTITGNGFGNAAGPLTAVNFGSVPAGSFTYVSATSITAVSPAVTTVQTVDITVIVSGATSAINQPGDQFTYAAPTVTSLTTNTSGPATGGTTVTINGTNFVAGATATFGGVSAGSVTFVSSTQLTALSPAFSASGPVDVIVTSGASSAASSADQFTYMPAVTSLSPTLGTISGGTSVTITGAGFTSVTAVNFGTSPAASYTVNSPTLITASSPPSPSGADGVFDVTVTATAGTSATSAADKYTFSGAGVSSIATVPPTTPPSGPTTGGTTVTITGAGFTGATGVAFGSTALTTVGYPAIGTYVINSDTSITAVTPPATNAGGPVNVIVTAAGLGSNLTSKDQFTFELYFKYSWTTWQSLNWSTPTGSSISWNSQNIPTVFSVSNGFYSWYAPSITQTVAPLTGAITSTSPTSPYTWTGYSNAVPPQPITGSSLVANIASSPGMDGPFINDPAGNNGSILSGDWKDFATGQLSYYGPYSNANAWENPVFWSYYNILVSGGQSSSSGQLPATYSITATTTTVTNSTGHQYFLTSDNTPNSPLGRTSYVGNSGMYYFNMDTSNPANASYTNGPFYQDSHTKLTDIVDGTSNTLLFGESLGGPDNALPTYQLTWMGTGTMPSYWDCQTPSQYFMFSSMHPGVVNFAFCDGSVRSITKVTASVPPDSMGTQTGTNSGDGTNTNSDTVKPPAASNPATARWIAFQLIAGIKDNATADLLQLGLTP